MKSINKYKKQGLKTLLKGALLSASALTMVAFIIPASFFTPVKDNDFLKQLRKETEGYNAIKGGERLYLQFDRPMYEPGDDIWFAAYLRDALSMKESSYSDIVHIEMLDPKGSVMKQYKIIAKEGKAAGDFKLDADANGGIYKIRAFTQHMKNNGEDNVFEKEFQVQKVVLPNLKMKLDFERKAFGPGDEVMAKLQLNTNENKPLSNYSVKYVCNVEGKKVFEKAEMTDEDGIKIIRFNLPEKLNSNDGLLNVMISYNGSTESVSRSIPIVLNKIAMNFFPEGGDLVSGLESNVGFKALNEFGRPADVEGIITTEKGSVVASFNSFHQGMGAFKLVPQNGEKYFAKITRPANITEKYELPAANDAGYVLNIDNTRPGEITAAVQSTENEEMSLVAQMRGKILYANAVMIGKGSNKIIFPTAEMPAGVAQITLFDTKGIARCERLTFVNKERELTVKVEAEKEKYLPREKVKLNITVKDERGLGVPANLSMSVVNDQFLSFADDKSGNILSQLLLEQDVKGKVEEPAFYFDKKEVKADKALDYLLMTNGWRHFTWQEVLKPGNPYASFADERAEVSGVVMNAYTYKPITNATVKVSNGRIVKTDSLGRFSLRGLDLYDPLNLTASAIGYNNASQYVYDYTQGVYLYLYNPKEMKQYYHENKKYSKSKNAKYYAPRANMVEGEVAFDAIPQMAAEKVELQEVMVVEKAAKNNMVANAAMKVNKDVKVAGQAKENIHNNDEVAVFDKRAKNFGGPAIANINNNGTQYYRARKFATPVYGQDEKVETRTDFRNTIYWNPEIEIGSSGKKSVEFYASDDITSLRATVEGIGVDGTIGRAETVFYTQLPFAMSTKIPVEVATDDVVSIPLTLKNNTNGPLGGLLTVTKPDGFEEVVKIPEVQTIMPGKAKTIYLDYKVLDKIGYGDMTISFKSCGLGDAFTQKIKIAPKGFPVNYSFSGQQKDNTYDFTIDHLVSGSVQAKVMVYPNVVSDLLKGIEGILREPSGCFEQTSMSSYPNAMVLDYLHATDSKDDRLLASATGLLDRGYKKLTTFETKEKGYEWFGSNPGHEALTAYGLMQFSDMKKAGGKVDQDMVDRTAKWLMDRRDGKGGFERNGRALDYFGRASEQVTNAYIVYSLSEAGFTDIKKEFNASYEDAKKGDAYVMALVANAAYNLNEKSKGDALLSDLMKKQNKEGIFSGAAHSITFSTGQSLDIETTSLAMMAMMKSKSYTGELMNSVKWLMTARNGYGAFGNTQGTILALKALTEFAKYSRKTSEGGTVIVYVDGKKAAEKTYEAGSKDAIVLDGMEKYIGGEGKHDIRVKFADTKEALPYSVAVSYNTSLPKSNTECVVDLQTRLFSKTAGVGETVRMSVLVSNKKNEGIPSTMVIVGIPAGFTVQPWQLKELQEKKVFDYYEINGNNIAIYYRCMQPSAKKEINLDLKAEMPGEYDAPAASAYLYYTNELKTWAGLERVTIKKG